MGTSWKVAEVRRMQKWTRAFGNRGLHVRGEEVPATVVARSAIVICTDVEHIAQRTAQPTGAIGFRAANVTTPSSSTSRVRGLLRGMDASLADASAPHAPGADRAAKESRNYFADMRHALHAPASQIRLRAQASMCSCCSARWNSPSNKKS